MALDPTQGKLPPHDVEAEDAVIGAMLLASDRCTDVLEMLVPEDFYAASNATIYQHCLALLEKGGRIDVVTLLNRIKDHGHLGTVGGVEAVNDRYQAVPSMDPTDIVAYAQIVKNKARLRKTLKVCQEATAQIYCKNIVDASGFIDGLESKIFNITQEKSTRQVDSIVDIVADAYSGLQKAAIDPTMRVGIPSGLPSLDALTGGFRGGDSFVVAGRPGMSKSSLILNFGRWVCVDGYAALILSLEMPKSQLGERLLAIESGVNVQRIREPTTLQADDFRALKVANERIGKYTGRLWIDDTPELTPLDVRAKVRRAAVRAVQESPRKKLAFVGVDYIQLMKVPGQASREIEIGMASRAMKSIAKEFDTTLVVLSQLNRAVENRTDRRPQLSDLRDSGSIEQDADRVLFLYRDAYYSQSDDETTELILAKARNGPTGTVNVRFEGPYTRFSEIEVT